MATHKWIKSGFDTAKCERPFKQRKKELSTTTTTVAATARDRNKFNFQNFVYVDEKRALSLFLFISTKKMD